MGFIRLRRKKVTWGLGKGLDSATELKDLDGTPNAIKIHSHSKEVCVLWFLGNSLVTILQHQRSGTVTENTQGCGSSP